LNVIGTGLTLLSAPSDIFPTKRLSPGHRARWHERNFTPDVYRSPALQHPLYDALGSKRLRQVSTVCCKSFGWDDAWGRCGGGVERHQLPPPRIWLSARQRCANEPWPKLRLSSFSLPETRALAHPLFHAFMLLPLRAPRCLHSHERRRYSLHFGEANQRRRRTYFQKFTPFLQFCSERHRSGRLHALGPLSLRDWLIWEDWEAHFDAPSHRCCQTNFKLRLTSTYGMTLRSSLTSPLLLPLGMTLYLRLN